MGALSSWAQRSSPAHTCHGRREVDTGMATMTGALVVTGEHVVAERMWSPASSP